MDGRANGQTKGISIVPIPLRGGGLKKDRIVNSFVRNLIANNNTFALFFKEIQLEISLLDHRKSFSIIELTK